MQKAFAAILIICITCAVAFAIVPAPGVEARANIINYLETNPNGFEPSGHDRLGTASEIICNRTANWTIFSNMGNLGIGNGSVATFGDQSSLPSNYTDQYFMGADVSQAPLDPVRELNLNVASPVAAGGNETGNASSETGNATAENSTAVNNSSSMPPNAGLKQAFRDITVKQALNNASLPEANNTSQPSVNTTTNETANQTANETANQTANETASQPVSPALTPENLTYTANHPISIGRPVNDLLYEHPFATSISTYGRLVGLETAAGPVNVGIRCLSYGY